MGSVINSMSSLGFGDRFGANTANVNPNVNSNTNGNGNVNINSRRPSPPNLFAKDGTQSFLQPQNGNATDINIGDRKHLVNYHHLLYHQ